MSGNGQRGRPGHWWRRLILADVPDVLGLLLALGRVSLEAVEAFEAWSQSGDGKQAERVRDLEHRADDARRALVTALRDALATPIDQENVYILSERCDRVVNAAKNLVRQAQTLEWQPDGFAAEMAGSARRAMERLCQGFETLAGDPVGAGSAADAALKATRAVEYSYRHAIAELAGGRDLRAVLAGQEIYRRYALIGELVAATADRLWYAVLSET